MFENEIKTQEIVAKTPKFSHIMMFACDSSSFILIFYYQLVFLF